MGEFSRFPERLQLSQEFEAQILAPARVRATKVKSIIKICSLSTVRTGQLRGGCWSDPIRGRSRLRGTFRILRNVESLNKISRQKKEIRNCLLRKYLTNGESILILDLQSDKMGNCCCKNMKKPPRKGSHSKESNWQRGIAPRPWLFLTWTGLQVNISSLNRFIRNLTKIHLAKTFDFEIENR